MAEQTAILSPTPNQVVSAQQRAISQAENIANRIEGIQDQDDSLVREILPDQDFTSGGNNGWAQGDREWLQQGLTAGQQNATYDIDSNNEAQNKGIVVYGLTNVGSDPLTTEVAFQDGTGATFWRLNLQTLEIAEIADAVVFEQPIVYGATEDGTIQQWPEPDDGDDHLVFMAKVVEPLGETVSTRQEPSRRFGGG